MQFKVMKEGRLSVDQFTFAIESRELWQTAARVSAFIVTDPSACATVETRFNAARIILYANKEII